MKLHLELYGRLSLLILLMIAGISSSFAPSHRAPTRMPAVMLPIGNPEPYGDFTSLNIPLKRVGRLLLVEAVIDGVSGNLVFDTGATGLVLNKTYFRKHQTIESSNAQGITGSNNDAASTVVERIDVSEMFYKNIKADIADLSHLENRKGVKIIGLFGYDMIRSFETVINVHLNELQLHRLDRKGERLDKSPGEETFDDIQKIDPWRPVLILKGEIGGKALNFCFDTGAEANVINNRAHKNVLNTITITRRSNLGGAGQASSEVLYGVMTDFKLGNTSLNNMETILVNLDALREVYGVQIDGMLGFGFMEKGIISINLLKKEFRIRYFKTEES